MIEAELPDGRVLEFPEGTDPSVIQSTVKRVLAETKRPSFGGGLAQAGLQGATLATADEIQGPIAAATASVLEGIDQFAKAAERGFSPAQPPVVPLQEPTFSERSQEATDLIRAENETFSRENPGASIAANVAGGIATGAPVVKALQAAKVPITGFRGVVTSGGIVGAGAGAGAAKEGERLEGALEGGALGVLFGGAASVAGAEARRLIRRFAPEARTKLVELAKASGLTPAQIQTRLSALGPKATLADVAEVFQMAADVAASRLGPTAKRVQALIRRDETQFGRITGSIHRMLGGTDDAVKTVSALKEIRRQKASPLYEQAFARPIQMTETLKDLLERPITKGAWRKVQQLGKSDPDVDVASLAEGVDPSFRGWQHITEELSEKVTTAFRNGHNKRAAILGRLRQRILDELDAQSPEFREARGLWASTKRADDMLEMGGDFMKMGADEIREAMEGMSPVDAQFFRLGIGRAIEGRLAKATDTTDLGRVFRNQDFREKAEAAFPDKTSVVDFINTVRAETIKKATTNKVGRGSQTQPRKIVEDQLGSKPISLESLTPTGVARGVAEKAIEGFSGVKEKTIQDLGDILLTMDPNEQAKALRALTSGIQNPLLQLSAPGAAAANLSGQGALR